VPSERNQASVLVVDDSATDRRLVGGLLQRAGGLSVEYAVDGKDAISRFQESIPELVITDLIMPELDGLGLVAAVKSEFPLVPVVLMTARGNEEIALAALREGAAGYVPKRILAHDLVPTAKRILAATREDRSLSRLMHRMVQNQSSFVLDNDPSLIPLLLGYLQQAIRCVRLGDELDRLRIRLAVEEALLNALYRGNLEVSSRLQQSDPAAYDELVQTRLGEVPYCNRRTFVSWSISREGMEITIRDEGPGFESQSSENRSESVDFDTAFGRGTLIMRTFMDEARYNASGNEVTLLKHAQVVVEAAADQAADLAD
jgi:CheY-like chemotaxis protein